MASMKDLMKHAQKTREQVVDPSSTQPLAPQGYEVPKCATCGAPREAAEAKGALAAPCRFCGTR